MQNVFPARELYNSNPCQEMWDSEQFSQGSQNSSSDLFSQSSKTNQLKGFNSFDVWSQPTNSQQISEDEPVKYYMKYMSKPPLFSSETERQSRQQKPQAGASYRELIEIQKKKTTERDDRDVLDSFISLLKDYTKEVKTAMDSFKDSIDTTLTSKAEKVASAASESAEMVKKLKDDLLEGFGSLRKDLKENGELKEIITKQNERILEQESQIKMLQVQLDDYRAREEKSVTEKQERYLEREDKLLKKLDEIGNWKQPAPQMPLPLNPTSMRGGHQTAECLLHPGERCAPQNQSVTTYQPQVAWDRTEAPTSVRLHHMQPAPYLSLHNPTREAFRSTEHAANYTQAVPALGYQYHSQSSTLVSESAPSLSLRGQDDAVVPASAVNIPMQQNQQTATHPTAAIAPMRPASNEHDQQLLSQQERNVIEPVISQGEESTLPALEVIFVPDKQPQEAKRALTSPGTRPGILSKKTWPKHSPVVTVQPQIRVKRESDGEKTKVLGPPCAKKIRKEDPFDIFVFDLTSSSDEESCHYQNSNITSPNVAPKHPVNKYGTRSKKFQQINTQTFAESEKIKTRQRRANKSVSVTADPSVLRKKAISTSNFKEASSTDDKTCGYKKTSPSTNTPNRPVKASIEDGIPRSKVAQNVFQFQKSKTSFKRNRAAARRALSFDASVFVGFDDDENIQQITESIRRHAQRKKAAKVL